MRVLHLSKTSRGGRWASDQARVLVRRGIEVHVALPDLDGPVAAEWCAGGSRIYVIPYTLSPLQPHATWKSIEEFRRLVDSVRPDLIHAHSVKAAILARLALRKDSPPRIFQVPGPIHMDKWFFRTLELATATATDRWIATSRATMSRYLSAGIDPTRVFLSYAGTDNSRFQQPRTGYLRGLLGLRDDEFIVGNVSYIYSPKWYLQQTVGLKCHEDLIEGITLAAEKDKSIRGVLIGGPWEPNSSYYEKVRSYARSRSKGAVLMPGPMNSVEVARVMPDFDCVAHVPMSENCGGVVEPLLCGIPTIASRIGGLVEVVMDGATGITVPVHSPKAVAEAILQIRDHYASMSRQVENGRGLARAMFDVNRTAVEVHEIYRYLLGERTALPLMFNSREFVESINQSPLPEPAIS